MASDMTTRLKFRPLPSRKCLLALFDYEPFTGRLLWRARLGLTPHERAWNTRYAGKPALVHVTPNGYLQGRISGLNYQAHRVVWKMQTGEEPPKVDHKNGKRSDNRWRNLRAVDDVMHARNQGRRTDNTSGVVGVTFDKAAAKWRAQIRHEGKNIYVGNFTTKEKAVEARREAENKFGYFGGHGKREGFRV